MYVEVGMALIKSTETRHGTSIRNRGGGCSPVNYYTSSRYCDAALASVDSSLCRDGADMPIVHVHKKAF